MTGKVALIYLSIAMGSLTGETGQESPRRQFRAMLTAQT
jgi:hypothetical protein